ncbi:inositol 2-dehydrogenase [Leucobacter chromiiresistens]|uniref:Myo-inositol 2-dehydrogenase n=1 Tax=Leucobacter chromiiresistens TaxID=1079994 RepID=A0A1H0Y1T1_9MICO|nr:inositol 2-dehydrogenase [Leucobacter chromiiresistens]SDQ09108.1 myo-inositol 2-dehydrogenase [Leucobacter chromiiresistens]
MTAERLRFALIGTGRIGRVHAANIAANARTELAIVADPALGSADEVAARFGGKPARDPLSAIAPESVDAVVIASPTPTHIELITACIDQGVPVLSEKPIDLDMSRIDALRPRVRRASSPVAIGFNQRFDPAIAEVQRRVTAGEVGALEQLSITSRDPSPPPASYIGVSGGIFRDMTIHDFDLARFFAGEIEEVTAVGSTLFDAGAREHDDFDSVVVTLKARSGSIVTITNSRHSAYGYDQRIEAFGAGGLLNVENAPASHVTSSNATCAAAKAPYVGQFLDRYADAYANELDAFVEWVHHGASSSPTFEDGRAAQVLAEAAHLSSRAGRTVRIDEID